MAVYYSFHYDRDSWRVQEIINMGVVDGQPLLSSQDWEAVKRRGKAAIEKWIADQMANKTAVVVLVGAQTSTRPWVDYEIRYAWNNRKPLVGVRIHGLADKDGSTDSAGGDPFAKVGLQGGGTVANYVTLHNPAGTTSKDVYGEIERNLKTWVAGAYKRS